MRGYDSKAWRRLEIAVVGIAATLLLAWALSCGSWASREAKRWDGCLGKALTRCAAPAGYESPRSGCEEAEGCVAVAPAVRTFTSRRRGTAPGFLVQYGDAVLQVDARGRLVRVEVRTVGTSF